LHDDKRQDQESGLLLSSLVPRPEKQIVACEVFRGAMLRVQLIVVMDSEY
jgi:hypothetical protein